MEPDTEHPTDPHRTGEPIDVLTPALWGTGLVFAAVDGAPVAGRSVSRRARVRRLETLRPTTVGGDQS